MQWVVDITKKIPLGRYQDIRLAKKNVTETEATVLLTGTAFNDAEGERSLNAMERDLKQQCQKYGVRLAVLATYCNDTAYPGLIRYNRKVYLKRALPATTTEKSYPIEALIQLQLSLKAANL